MRLFIQRTMIDRITEAAKEEKKISKNV